jgi:hypothetical protein
MSTPFHTVVRNNDLIDSADYIAFNLPATVTVADIGKAVSLDTSGANKAKLSVLDDPIIGRLETVEVRSASQVVGTVSIRGIFKLPIKTGVTVNLGDTVEGSSQSGAVESAAAVNPALNRVVELVGSTHVIVMKF